MICYLSFPLIFPSYISSNFLKYPTQLTIKRYRTLSPPAIATISTGTLTHMASKFGRNQITIKNHTNINSRNCKDLQPKGGRKPKAELFMKFIVAV